jgi:hypothetical protein
VHDVVVVVTVKGARQARLVSSSCHLNIALIRAARRMHDGRKSRGIACKDHDSRRPKCARQPRRSRNLILSDDYEGGVAVTDDPGAQLGKLDWRLASLIGALDHSAEETARPLERALDELARTQWRLLS